jgi:hypothetical protein
MRQPFCSVAFKEWAVTIRAFDRGDQILLLRKGGIHEDGKEFRVLYPEFLMYPTFEHQKPELLKERYHGELSQVVSEAADDGTITFGHWARVEEAIELSDQAAVDSLEPYHIWTSDYAQKRLHWKPRHPLAILLVRLYRLEEPRIVPLSPSFIGCKSWVELSEPVRLGEVAPVMSDDEFHTRVQEVKAALSS